jgi:hypothetical protein
MPYVSWALLTRHRLRCGSVVMTRRPEKLLLDAQALGWVQHTRFASTEGWSLRPEGKFQNEKMLAAELVAVNGVVEVRNVYERFLPLNSRVQQACTDWQLRATTTDPLATNDHSDSAWDGRVIDELVALAQYLSHWLSDSSQTR